MKLFQNVKERMRRTVVFPQDTTIEFQLGLSIVNKIDSIQKRIDRMPRNHVCNIVILVYTVMLDYGQSILKSFHRFTSDLT